MTSENFEFKVLARDGAARQGEISMPRGVVRTPAFMPVGTAGTVDPPSRNFHSSGMMDFSSPLTVAGAAPVLLDFYILAYNPV